MFRKSEWKEIRKTGILYMKVAPEEYYFVQCPGEIAEYKRAGEEAIKKGKNVGDKVTFKIKVSRKNN